MNEKKVPIKPAKEKPVKKKTDGLLEKLVKIQEEIAYIHKGGVNTQQNYNFVRESEVTRQARDCFVKHRIHSTVDVIDSKINSTVDSKGKLVTLAEVIIRMRLTDLDSREVLEVNGRGCGGDYGAGDKAIYKAITGAVKYTLLKSLLIETGDDPEDERTESEKRSETDIVNENLKMMPQSVRDYFNALKMDRDKAIAYFKKLSWDWVKIEIEMSVTYPMPVAENQA
jgi:hypothetical protein